MEDLSSLKARLDAGPTVAKTERKLDAIGDQSYRSRVFRLCSLCCVARGPDKRCCDAGFPRGCLAEERRVDRHRPANRARHPALRRQYTLADEKPRRARADPSGGDRCIRFVVKFEGFLRFVLLVAVLAFKAVYALESTRQENDRRVATLYVEMKDMMMVMVQYV